MRVQYGALPYRFAADGSLEVLIVTTRRTRRWIIPKGWLIHGLTPAKSAAREAFEEAGVRGKVGAKAIGRFAYEKLLDEPDIRTTCEVKVFPLLAKSQGEVWPESGQRVARWVEPARAAFLIREPDLRKLVTAFAKRKSGTGKTKAAKAKDGKTKDAAKKAAPKAKGEPRPKAGAKAKRAGKTKRAGKAKKIVKARHGRKAEVVGKVRAGKGRHERKAKGAAKARRAAKTKTARKVKPAGKAKRAAKTKRAA